MDIIERALDGFAGKLILDAGCGTGSLLRALDKRDAFPVGIDTNLEVLETARSACPQARLVQANASALPFCKASFDGIIFLNSLHHVDEPDLDNSLAEAMRCIRAGCILMVLEPLCHGGSFEVALPIHDETIVRTTAMSALDGFIDVGGATEIDRVVYDTHYRVPDADTVISHALLVDGSRAGHVHGHRQEVHRRFSLHAREVDGHTVLDQPMIAVILQG